jgi:PAS domain S-box-containing protein
MNREGVRKPDASALRTAAEAALTRRAPECVALPDQALPHELEVHQIELEIQNEALRQAQIALEKSRDLYVDLYEFGLVGHLTLNLDGIITEVNLTATRMLGVERQKMLQQRFYAFVAPEDLDRWTQLFILIKKSDGKNASELAMLRSDGTVLHVQLDGVRAQSAMPRVKLTLTDITETKMVRQALHENAALHRPPFALSKIPVLLLDPVSGRIVDCNPGASRFYGYPQETLRQMGLSGLSRMLPEDIRDGLSSSITGMQDLIVWEHHLANGDLRQIEARCEPVEIGKRTLLYAVLSDISERRAVEKALVSETARMYALLETASDGIHILDRYGDLVQFSHSFAAMLGYTQAEMSGLNATDWEMRTGEDASPASAYLGITRPLTVETTHSRKDGTLIEVEVNATRVVIEGKHYIYASSRDISKRNTTEDKIENGH